jgi:hypothetical protein
MAKEQPSKRRRLGAAVQERCGALLKAQGYRNPAKGDWDRWLATRRSIFIRRRGEIYDELVFNWRTFNRPKFTIDVRTSEIGRMVPAGRAPSFRHLQHLRLRSWVLRAPTAGVVAAGHWFGPWRDVDSAITLACQRLEQLENYLMTGEPSWMIHFGSNDACRGPFDPAMLQPVFWPGYSDPELEPWPPKSRRRRS